MMAHLFENMRTRKQKLIFRAPVVKVQQITITPKHFFIFVDGMKLDWDERESLAQADGFKNAIEMAAFWQPQLRKVDEAATYWHGQIIHWDYDRRTTKKIPAPPRRRQQPTAKPKTTDKGKKK
jgi:hypothetical protein